MFVLQVEIEGHRYDETRRTHFARVVFKTETNTAMISCGLRLPEDIDQKKLSRALISDAVRQISRMPGYESGDTDVSFAPEALRTAPHFAA